MEDKIRFSTPDYVVFALVLFSSAAIGIYYALQGGRQKTSREYLMADRSMGFFPVAMSLMASLLTGIHIQGLTSEMYFRGTMFWWNIVPQAVTCWIAGRCFLPIYYNLQITSVYEYLELRFSPTIRNCGLVVCYLGMVLNSGIAMFAASLALKAVTGIDLMVSTFILCGVCTFYTTIGGMKAVLWADCFQMFIIIIGLICAIVKSSLAVGGLQEVWKIAEQDGRIIFDNFSVDPAEYATFWNITVFGAIGWLPAQAINQYQVQRFLTCKDFKTTNLALFTYGIGTILVVSLCCLAGLCIYAYYSLCDPYTQGYITFRDEIYPFFLVDTMHKYPGVPGLLIAGLCCLALSTVSSVQNALATITGQHIIKGIWKGTSESTYTLCTKGLVLLFGFVIVGATFLMSKMGDLVPTLLGVIGVTNGPILGVFCLGIFFKRTTSKGAWIGFVMAFGIGLWILLGSFRYPTPLTQLPLTTDGCTQDEYNSTTILYTYVTEIVSDATTESLKIESRPPIVKLYSVSKLWYSSITFGTCMLFGLLGSFVTGLGDPDIVDPNLICHLPSACCFFLPKSWRIWEKDEKNNIIRHHDHVKKSESFIYRKGSSKKRGASRSEGDAKNGAPEIYPMLEKA